MEYIRVINSEHWDPRRGNFKSLAFRNYNGGISLFDRACAESVSKSICRHIDKFYLSAAGTPVLFWVIDPLILPTECNIVSTVSSTGDTCHRDILKIGDKKARKVLKDAFEAYPENFYRCDDINNETNELNL